MRGSAQRRPTVLPLLAFFVLPRAARLHPPNRKPSARQRRSKPRNFAQDIKAYGENSSHFEEQKKTMARFAGIFLRKEFGFLFQSIKVFMGHDLEVI